MDIFARRTFSRHVLASFGIVEKSTKKDVHSLCCGVKMEQDGGILVCKICAKCKKNLGEYANKPESQKSRFSSTGAIQPGINTEKTVEEKNAVLNKEFSQLIISNNCVYDFEVLGRTADLFRKLSVGNTKKCDNRKQLAAACYWYSAIFAGNMVLTKDVVQMFGLRVEGISEGLNMLTTRVLTTNMAFEVSPLVHPLIIQYFLKKIVINGRQYFTEENDEFCNKVMNCMIEKNISYDTEMLANCAGVVYYLINFRKKPHESIKKKTLTMMMTLKQNIYNNPYNLLVKPEINKLLPRECQMIAK